MPYALTWLKQVPLKAGLKVAEVSGWQTRGHGDVGKILGVICHHTAASRNGNAPALTLVTKGRAAGPGTTALAGPLCNYHLARDGTVTVVAAGRAYHAGAPNPSGYRGLMDGNTHTIGIEAENDGVGEPWPAVQIEAYARLCAAIADQCGFDTAMVIGHKEWTRRKIDPAGIDMTAFRARVAAIRNGAPVAPPIPAVDKAGRPTLRRGATGKDVTDLQTAIGVKPDGIFGSGTEASLRIWQRLHGLVADGIAGPAVFAIIDHVKAAA